MTEDGIAGFTLTRAAPAKINLALHVVGKRADGYHELESLVVFAGLGDRLSVAPSRSDAFSVGGPFADGVPVDGTNLVLRARDALRASAGRGCPPVALSLEKRLPVASGIGGGSSDAAAALKALAEHWRLPAGCCGALQRRGQGGFWARGSRGFWL